MRLFLLSLLAVFGINLSAQTSLQYQAHVPFRASSVEFSAYIADSSFDEGSHINATAFWYVEGLATDVNNGIINVVLSDVPDSVFGQNEGNLFVYGYVNGQSLGRLPVYPVPYARFSNRANVAGVAGRAEIADFAYESRYADTAEYARNAGFADRADSSIHAVDADRAGIANVAVVARLAETSIYSDTATFAISAFQSVTSDTANWAHASGTSLVASSVVTNGVTLSALDGGGSAPIGSVLTRGVGGITWSVNPQYRAAPADIAIVTAVPTVLPFARWIVSRVATNYTIVSPTAPVAGTLITITNGSTANRVLLDGAVWPLDNGISYQIAPGVSKTLYFDGTSWIIIQ